eukprot:gene26491-35152_t
MANFKELDRIDEEIRRIDLESYLHEHVRATSIVDSENELDFLGFDGTNNEAEDISIEKDLNCNADQEPLLKNLALLRRGGPETTERLVSTIHEQELQAVQGRERQLQQEKNLLEYSLALTEQDKLLLEVSLKEVSDFEGRHVDFHGLDSVRGKLLSAANNRIAELSDQLLIAQNALRSRNADELKKVSEQLAQRAVLYAAQERRFLDNARIYTSEFSDRTSEIADVRGRLQQLERQYSITDRERMEAVFNQRQLQQALDTAQEAHRELQQQLEASQAELSSATFMITSLQETVDRLRSADLEELEMSFTREVEDLRQSFRVREDSLQQQLAHSQRLLSQTQVTATQYEEEMNNLRRKMYVLQAGDREEVTDIFAHLHTSLSQSRSPPANNDRMSNLTQPGDISSNLQTASANHGASLTYSINNNSVSNYYLSAAEDTLTLSVCSGPDAAALNRELELESALASPEGGDEEAEGLPQTGVEKGGRGRGSCAIPAIEGAGTARARIARNASFALLDETVGGYKETVRDLKLQISAQSSLVESQKEEIRILQGQVRLTGEEKDRQLKLIVDEKDREVRLAEESRDREVRLAEETKDREVRLAEETRDRQVRSIEEEKDILELQMEILKGDFELNLNAIAEMNLRFEQLLMINNRTEMECEDVRSALAEALSRHNLSASKVKFSEEMKRGFFDLSVSNIRLGRPYLSEVTPADKIERVSLIRTSPVDQMEENSLISDSPGNGGPWLFGEEKNQSGLGLGCGGSDTSNTSALGQVEQLLMQRNEFEMRIINMRESLLNSAESQELDLTSQSYHISLTEQLNEAKENWRMSCSEQESKKTLDEAAAKYKQESLNWDKRTTSLLSDNRRLEILCEGFRLDCSTLRTEIDEVNAEKDKVRLTLENLQADYENLTAELENTRNESHILHATHRQERKNHVDELSRDFHTAKEMLKSMEYSLTSLTAENKQLKTALTDFVNQDFRTKMDSLTLQLEDEKNSKFLREMECSSLRDTTAALSAELQSALSAKEQLQGDLTLLGLQTDNLRTEMKSLKRLLEEETISKSKQEAEYKELLTNTEAAAKVNLTSFSTRLIQERDERQSQVARLVTSLEEEKLLRTEIEAECERMRVDLTSLSANYNEEIFRNEILAEKIGQLESLTARQTSELSSQDELLSQLAAMTDAKNKADANYKALLIQEREKIELFETRIKENSELREERVSELQANLTELQHELDIKRTDVASLSASNATLTEEVKELKHFLHQVEESHVSHDVIDIHDTSQTDVDLTSKIETLQSSFENKQYELQQVGRLQELVTSLQAQLSEQKQRLRSRYLSKLQQQEEKFLREKQQLLELVKSECKQIVEQLMARPNLVPEDGSRLLPRPSLSDPVFHSPAATFTRPPVASSDKDKQPIHPTNTNTNTIIIGSTANADQSGMSMSMSHEETTQSIRNTIHNAAQTIQYANQSAISQSKLLASISEGSATTIGTTRADTTQPSRVFSGISPSANLQDSMTSSGPDLSKRVSLSSFSSPSHLSGTGGGGVRVPLSVSMPVIYPEMLSPELTLELVQKIVGRTGRIYIDKPVQT